MQEPDIGTDNSQHFDADYYRSNGQFGDRPALGFYTRLVRRYLASHDSILDFGCGTGHLVRHLQTLGTVSGFEVSEFSAQRVAEVAPGSTVYTSADDIPSAAFEALVSVHVVEHLTDEIADAAVATWRRVLRRGGRALVVTPDPAGRARELTGAAWNGFSDPTHINLKSHAEWREFLTERGFDVVRENSDGLWNVPYSSLPKPVDALRYATPALAQFVSGRLFLRPGVGESSIFVLQRRDE